MSRKLDLPIKALIPFREWLDRFNADEKSTIGLFEFFQDHFQRMSKGDLILDTQRTRNASPALRSTGGVSIELMEMYIDSWRTVGFLD